jgi:hypothetical protein
MDWKSQRKLTHLLFYCKELNIGHCGGVGPLQKGKREKVHMGGTGGRSSGLPRENECVTDESDERMLNNWIFWQLNRKPLETSWS